MAHKIEVFKATCVLNTLYMHRLTQTEFFHALPSGNEYFNSCRNNPKIPSSMSRDRKMMNLFYNNGDCSMWLQKSVLQIQ